MSTVIEQVVGRRVWDSRGRPTVEAEVRLAGGAVGRAIAPAGASRGTREAVDLRDGGAAARGFGVDRAVGHVGGAIAAALAGRDAADQGAIDALLIALDGTPTKSRLGGNAVIATSMAVLQAAAAAAGVPLWRHLDRAGTATLPLPEIQIFGGGAHAGRRVDIQDFMVMAPAAGSFAEALAITGEVYWSAARILEERGRLYGVADEGGWWPAFDDNTQALDTLVAAIEGAGYTPGDEVVISLDVAASEFGRDGAYRLALEDRSLDRDAMIGWLVGLIDRYPVVSIEDPLGEDDAVGMAAFTREVGGRVQIVGDDFLVTDAALMREAAAAGACNAVLVKPNQIGTVTETRAALDAAAELGWTPIVSARSGETEDVFIVHLSTGLAAGQLKVGSFSRSERMAKWNEAIRIEESMGAGARFAGGAPLAATWWGRGRMR